MRSFSVVGFAAFAMVLLGSGVAEAASNKVWAQMDGCAREIAVSGKNVPWVLGCDSNRSIYFRGSKPSACANGVCLNEAAWIPAGGGARFISLGIGGAPAVVDKNGALWLGMWSSLGAVVANTKPSQWVKMSTYMPDGKAACIQSFAQGSILTDFWAVGCGGNPNAPIYLLDPIWLDKAPINAPWVAGTGVWRQLGAQYANAGTTIAAFNAVSGNSATQNPWLVASGSIWAYNGSYFDWVPAPNDGQVTAVTDGHILSGGEVYRWNGNIYGGGGGATPWTREMDASGPAITRIAYSARLGGGSSALYGLDGAGNIYVKTTIAVVK
jgi:hypothetical protein